MEARRPDFFVSYAAADVAWARWIAWELEEAGYRTILQDWDFGPGQNFIAAMQRASEQARAVAAVVSDAYLTSRFAQDEWTAAMREGKLLPVRVSGRRPAGVLGPIVAVELGEVSQDEARKRLREAAERFLAGGRAKPADAPSFPRPVEDRPVNRPPRFPATLPEYVAMNLDLRTGDILETQADVVAFKHAGEFYGADYAAARRLLERGTPLDSLRVGEGESRVVDAGDALTGDLALFIGVGELDGLSYDGVRTFARRAVEISHGLGKRHLAMTLHGAGIGLDERESFLAQVAGYLEALQHLEGPSTVGQITIVERQRGRVEICGATLEEHLGEIPNARLDNHAPGEFTFRIGAGPPPLPGSAGDEPPQIDLLTRTPEEQPHIFVAYPFALEDHARYGIAQPANEAGLLARLINDQAWTGEILQRIKQQIEHSVLVVAVLTGGNPNVCLEVGYAWGKGRPTVLVADDPEKVPFDLRGDRMITYESIHDLEQKFAAELAGLRSDGVF
jgi:TIR domain